MYDKLKKMNHNDIFFTGGTIPFVPGSETEHKIKFHTEYIFNAQSNLFTQSQRNEIELFDSLIVPSLYFISNEWYSGNFFARIEK